ncbi:hypothetical protein RJT34_08715 [Clitoria ternatea]|uniref:Uncharacterized protein n=1 Tax=Clitoria ternatea TaxID=43366 RepID=A0AAN9K504_CLITE
MGASVSRALPQFPLSSQLPFSHFYIPSPLLSYVPPSLFFTQLFNLKKRSNVFGTPFHLNLHSFDSSTHGVNCL